MRERSTCTLDGCSEPHKARGRCSKHYQQWTAANRATLVADAAARADAHRRGCTVDDCGAPIKSRGMCRPHYLQWWRTGDPVPPAKPTECAVDDCAEPPYCRGWCVRHYKRWYYTDDPVKRAAEISCELCGRLFVRPPDGTTQRCDDCRVVARRETAAGGGRRRRMSPRHHAVVTARRQAVSRPCPLCGGEVEQGSRTGPLSQFCSDECREAYQYEWHRSYRARNRDKLQARQHRRRARKHGARYEVFKPSEIFERDGWRCYLCGEAIDPDLDHGHPRRVVLEHVIPLERDGDHTRANTRAAHSVCNNIKGTKLLSELQTTF